MNCVDSLTAALCRLAKRKMPSNVRCDSGGSLRVIVARPTTFPDVLNDSLDQIRQYGRSSVGVTLRLLEGLNEIAKCTSRQQDREAVKRHADMILRSGIETLPEELDRLEVQQRHQRVLDSLAMAETVAV